MQSVVDERIRMELSGDDTDTKIPRYSGRKTCPIVTLSIKERAWNGLVQDPDPGSEMPMTNRLTHDCFFCIVSHNGFNGVLQISACDCVKKKLGVLNFNIIVLRVINCSDAQRSLSRFTKVTAHRHAVTCSYWS